MQGFNVKKILNLMHKNYMLTISRYSYRYTRFPKPQWKNKTPFNLSPLTMTHKANISPIIVN